ncbi:MAG: hypothetical protein QM569_00905 [Acidovorax sp.]|uniref:hypothetical protein n=1 Tax=Acidovorax sp. TaxID=1872122 RepID=UPI0039E302AE
MTTPADRAAQRAQRTYYVSDERLHAFGQLSALERLQWVEQCSHFVRLAQAALHAPRPPHPLHRPPAP